MDDLISRQAAIEVADAVWSVTGDVNVAKVWDQIKDLPSATCDDCIWHVCNYNKVDWNGENDCISRQAAIDVLEREKVYCTVRDGYTQKNIFDKYNAGLTDGIKALKNLPSARPEQKKGRWIKMSDADGIYYCCSECGEELYRKWSFDRDYDLFPKKESIERTNFCSNCGADMREREDE